MRICAAFVCYPQLASVTDSLVFEIMLGIHTFVSTDICSSKYILIIPF